MFPLLSHRATFVGSPSSTGLRHERSEWWLAFLVLGWQDDSLGIELLVVGARRWACGDDDLAPTCSFVSQHPAGGRGGENFRRTCSATVDKAVITVM
jgi:hypothetical protein